MLLARFENKLFKCCFVVETSWTQLATGLDAYTCEKLSFIAVRNGEGADGPGLLMLDDVMVRIPYSSSKRPLLKRVP